MFSTKVTFVGSCLTARPKEHDRGQLDQGHSTGRNPASRLGDQQTNNKFVGVYHCLVFYLPRTVEFPSTQILNGAAMQENLPPHVAFGGTNSVSGSGMAEI